MGARYFAQNTNSPQDDSPKKYCRLAQNLLKYSPQPKDNSFQLIFEYLVVFVFFLIKNTFSAYFCIVSDACLYFYTVVFYQYFEGEVVQSGKARRVFKCCIKSAFKVVKSYGNKAKKG